MEIKTEVKVVYHKVKMLCDSCIEGEMLHTGIVLTSYPPQYEHRCNVCNSLANYTNNYPYIEQEYV